MPNYPLLSASILKSGSKSLNGLRNIDAVSISAGQASLEQSNVLLALEAKHIRLGTLTASHFSRPKETSYRLLAISTVGRICGSHGKFHRSGSRALLTGKAILYGSDAGTASSSVNLQA
jgi:hypothetical protein